MNQCKGLTLKGKKCKNKCQNKYCNKHSNKQKGGNGILKKPKKVGRFTVTKDNTSKSVNFDDNVVEKVIKIEKNDCPRHLRPRLKKTKLSFTEHVLDKMEGVNRTKKYQKFCPPGTIGYYITKNGNKCCKMNKKTLNPDAKEFKM